MTLRRSLSALLIALAPSIAWAHATLVSSTPAVGSRIGEAPPQLRLVFSEPVVANLSRVRIVVADGRAIALVIAADPRNPRAIVAPLSLRASGAYSVEWQIVSADGHPVSGQFTFTIEGQDNAAAPTVPPVVTHSDRQRATSAGQSTLGGDAVLPAILRGVALCALLALCGLLGFTGYSPLGDDRQRRVCAWLAVVATISFGAHLVAWLAYVSPTGAVTSTVMRETLMREVGLNELVRLVLVLLAAWAVLLARRFRLAFAFALAAVIAGGAIGHPATITPVVSIPAKALHLTGVAFWFGGLLWIVTADRSSMRTISDLNIVSTIALVSTGVVALTGIVQGVLFLPAFSSVWDSAYGLAFLGKVAGLLLLMGFGAVHRYRMLPRIGLGESDVRLRRSVSREVGVMLLVIMLGGFLAYIPTPQP